MSNHQQRIEVFEDTLDWIHSDQELSDSVIEAKKNTHVYYEHEYPSFSREENPSQTISVSPSRSFEAATRLRFEYPSARIAVMNFANAFHAGGGVTKGSSAQEECLCRTSTLYPLIYRKTLRDTFYQYHKTLNSPRASDALIYTHGVIVCKSDTDLPERLPREKWIDVDVITVAAPDLRDKSNEHFDLISGGTYMSDAELFGYHVRRAMHILTCAAYEGADVLVLGAFGCGAFRNSPEVVARAYKVALAEFPSVFTHVEFAVFCPPNGSSENYDVFKRVLSC